jgi:hypothetical protein
MRFAFENEDQMQWPHDVLFGGVIAAVCREKVMKQVIGSYIRSVVLTESSPDSIAHPSLFLQS